MKAYLPLCALVFGATVLTTACKDETTSFGADIMPEADKVITEQLTVKMPTKTVKTGAIDARTNKVSSEASSTQPLISAQQTDSWRNSSFPK